MNVWIEQPLRLDLPAHPRPQAPLQLVVCEVADREAALLPLEQPAVARAVTKRRWEFASGRWCARKSMTLMGLSPSAIPQQPGRAPAWPVGLVGSISHTERLASAALASRRALAGLGHDMELLGRLTRNLWPKLFTGRELAELDDDVRATVMFSAKEALYKAVNPLVGDFIGFQEAELAVDWTGGTFSARYLGEAPANRVMAQGTGWFWCWPDMVLTLFVIPAAAVPDRP